MFKCDPERFAELVEQEDIIPAPHFGRYNWVAFERLDVLPWSDVKDLIAQSYEMVAAKAKVGRVKAAKPKAKSRKGKVATPQMVSDQRNPLAGLNAFCDRRAHP